MGWAGADGGAFGRVRSNSYGGVQRAGNQEEARGSFADLAKPRRASLMEKGMNGDRVNGTMPLSATLEVNSQRPSLKERPSMKEKPSLKEQRLSMAERPSLKEGRQSLAVEPPQSFSPKRRVAIRHEADRQDEILLSIKDWLDSMKMRTREVFANYDTDGNGEIDEQELRTVLKSLEMDMTDSDVHDLFNRVAKGRGSVMVKDLDRAMKKSVRKVRPDESPSPRSASVSPPRTPGPSETPWGRIGPPPKELVEEVNQKLDSPRGSQHSPGRQGAGQLGSSPSLASTQASTPGRAKGGKAGYFGGGRQPPASPATPVSSRGYPASPRSLTSSDQEQFLAVPWEVQELRRILLAKFQSVRRAFAALDTSRDGRVSLGELGYAFDRLRIPWAEICGGRDVKMLFRGLDNDHSGSLTCRELLGADPEEEEVEVGDTVMLNMSLFGYSKGSRVKVVERNDDEVVVAFAEGHQVKLLRAQVTKVDEEVKKSHRFHLRQHMAEVRELEDPIAIRLFADWCCQDNKWATFEDLFYTETWVSGMPARRAVSKAEFVKFSKQHGFKGDCDVIFREILNECRTEKEEMYRRKGQKPSDEITFAHFKTFQWRCVGHVATLKASEWGSPASILVNALRHKRGTSLRGWRLDVDLRQNGRVAYVDFSNAMRKLGMRCQVKQIWNTMRPDGNAGGYIRALEFQELDPAEAAIMESFCDCLFQATAFDLPKAFGLMDTRNLKVLDFEDFTKGCQKLGYRGDERHLGVLFHGLDSRGLHKITVHDLEYLQKVSRRGHKVSTDSTGQSQLLERLISWVQRELGGVNGLIDRLGISNGRSIEPEQLERFFSEMGFNGDIQRATAMVARQAYNNEITADVLHHVLSGHTNYKRKNLSSPTKKRPLVVAKQVWKDSLYDPVQLNATLPRCSRQYFSVPCRDTNDYCHYIGPQRIPCRGTHRSLMRTTATRESIRSPGRSRQGSPRPGSPVEGFRFKEEANEDYAMAGRLFGGKGRKPGDHHQELGNHPEEQSEDDTPDSF